MSEQETFEQWRSRFVSSANHAQKIERISSDPTEAVINHAWRERLELLAAIDYMDKVGAEREQCFKEVIKKQAAELDALRGIVKELLGKIEYTPDKNFR